MSSITTTVSSDAALLKSDFSSTASLVGGAAPHISSAELGGSIAHPVPLQAYPLPRDTGLLQPQTVANDAFAKYSLIGHIDRLEQNLVDQKFILGELALLGQATTFYARPNTGKTLITLHLAIDGVRKKLIDPSRLYYINMDDDLNGLILKGRIAEQYGFHMISSGYNSFDVNQYVVSMNEMTINNTASGAVVVIDTLTRFVDTMDKKASRLFTKIVRNFVLKGGTFLALGHANKQPGANGKIVYAGTADIVNDFDCIYTVEEFPERLEKDEKTVVFENKKRRGANAQSAGYSYSVEPGITYHEMLASVRAVNPEDCLYYGSAVVLVPDATLTAAIEACIQQGITQKMLLGDAAAALANVSERQAIRVLEKFCGDDPTQHRWTFRRGARGVHIYSLLEKPEATPQAGASLKAA